MKKVIVEENLDNLTIVIKQPQEQEPTLGLAPAYSANAEPQLHAQLVFTDEVYKTPPLQTADGSEPVTLVFRKIMNGDKRFWVATGTSVSDKCGTYWLGDNPNNAAAVVDVVENGEINHSIYTNRVQARLCHEVEIEDEE